MKKMIIGIAPQQAIHAHTLAIRGHRACAKQSVAYVQDDGALWSGGDAAGVADGEAGGKGQRVCESGGLR